ncbi:Uncharacterized protein Fot_19159 [Forsythia ovata]|uniref:ATP synthase F0 subunit 6 n=1 Tax=Forsythia ovata TaxID=205694 RepID=A0ABD1VMB0_9LAMI
MWVSVSAFGNLMAGPSFCSFISSSSVLWVLLPWFGGYCFWYFGGFPILRYTDIYSKKLCKDWVFGDFAWSANWYSVILFTLIIVILGLYDGFSVVLARPFSGVSSLLWRLLVLVLVFWWPSQLLLLVFSYFLDTHYFVLWIVFMICGGFRLLAVGFPSFCGYFFLALADISSSILVAVQCFEVICLVPKGYFQDKRLTIRIKCFTSVPEYFYCNLDSFGASSSTAGNPFCQMRMDFYGRKGRFDRKRITRGSVAWNMIFTLMFVLNLVSFGASSSTSGNPSVTFALVIWNLSLLY